MVHCVMTPLVAEDEIYTSLNVIYKSEWIPFHENDRCHKGIQTQTLVMKMINAKKGIKMYTLVMKMINAKKGIKMYILVLKMIKAIKEYKCRFWS